MILVLCIILLTHTQYICSKVGHSLMDAISTFIVHSVCLKTNKHLFETKRFFCHVEKEECIAFMDIAVQPGMQNVENKYK